MRLTYQTDYGLRLLMYLAVRDGETCRVADIAESYGISRNHLLKVALRLGKLGYVTTLRGRAGGIVLALPPEDINLGQVVRQMEDSLALVECMGAQGSKCIISPACKLRGVINKALNAFLSVFDTHTLADIVGNSDDLFDLLGLVREPGSMNYLAEGPGDART
jgi:Rrf2 family nitric oxide-sensitive transcriptional repressor